MDERAGAPLAGVRVLDLTHVISGPYAAQMLADMGADVVKIERPGVGDDLRTVGRYAGREDHEDYFNASNRRKRSVTLDLKSEQGRAQLRALAAVADVVLQNFAPGTAYELGVDAETLRALNPRLVYCAISGFGQSGPLRDRLALDPVIQAMSGVMSVTGDPAGEPMQIGSPLADVIAGMFGAYATVCALRAAERTGIGATIDVSMLESMLAVLGPRMGETLQAGRSPERIGNENPMRVPAGMFRTGDGAWFVFIVQNQAFWKPFCLAIGREAWIDDRRFATMTARVANRAELNALIAEVLAEAPLDAWIERFNAQQVPNAPVYDFREALEQDHIRARGQVLEVDHPHSGTIRLVGPPWHATFAAPALTPPPLLGEHTEDVFAEWLGARR